MPSVFLRCFVLILAIAVLAVLAAPAGASVLDRLGDYERTAVERVMATRGLVAEEEPGGKRVGRIIVSNMDVFSPDDGFLQWFNIFHRTTRPGIIAREVLIRPGEVWDPDKVAETERKLRDPIFTTLAVAVPVQAAEPGVVDLLVVTRDVWSLRLNSNFEFQQNKLTFLTLSLSENNFLGWRKLASGVFELREGDYSIGPLYVDKNLLGRRLQLIARGGPIFNRDTSELEGSSSVISLSRPLWSLDSEWGAGVSFQHRFATNRIFQGAELLTYDAPETDVDDMVPQKYRERSLQLTTSVVRAFGKAVRSEVTLGHELESERYAVTDDLAVSDVVRDAFERDVLPRSERSSAGFLAYRIYTPRYVEYRNVATYDLPEDTLVGPDVRVTGALALRAIGSEASYGALSVVGSWTGDLGGQGFWRAGGTASTRIQGGEAFDQRYSAFVRVVAPPVGRWFRVVARVEGAALVDERNNAFLSLGGESGLRGYIVRELIGQRRIVGNLELRSLPVAIGFTRGGVVAFWDVGDAADRVGELRARHDFGVGLRFLIPQLSPLVYRLDWAVATDGVNQGFPGRITAGLGQIF